MISPRADCVLSGLNSEQLQRLVHVGESIELDKNKIIIAEGHKDRCFYYIIEGSVEIYKNSGTRNHVLTTLSAGETVGELALVDDHARSASVKTLEPVKMFRFDIERLYQDPEYADILSSIDSKIGKQLSQRLRLINEVTVAVLRRKFAMSIFSIRALVLLSLYALSLSFIEKSKHLLPSTTPLSLVLIFIFSLVTYSVIRQSGYPREDYGLSIKNAPQHIFEAVLYSLPIMVLIVLIKWLAITHISSLSHYPLFDPAAMFKQGALFHWNIYFIAMFFYALFCPLQEFIVRGCMQSSFQNLIEGTATRKKWEAIFVSNLLFSSAHAHTSTGFAIITFVPGMFWGWLYYRQKTLVGVSVSHILIGVWAAFIIGFQNMI